MKECCIFLSLFVRAAPSRAKKLKQLNKGNIVVTRMKKYMWKES